VGAFGDKFRKAREAKNLSLDDVSNVTKIAARMLQAIEQERFDQLPGGVFNKGFIRAYAKHLGLNDEEAITDYLACLRQAQIDAHEVWEPVPPVARSVPHQKPAYQKPAIKAHPPVQEPVKEELPHLQLPRAEDARPPRPGYAGRSDHGIPWSIVAVAALVIVLGIVLWVRHSRSVRIEAAHAATTNPAAAIQPPSAPANANPPTESQPAAHQSSSPSQSGNASASQPQAALHPAAIQPPAPGEKKTAAISQSNPQPKAQTSQQTSKPTGDEENEQNDVITRSLVPATAPKTKAAARMTLVIRASETSWISVTADGQSVTHETLIAPAETSFHAAHEIVARIGNAGGVSFLFNGQEIPAQGSTAEVKTFLFDSNGMREIPSQPPVQNR
jgi:cytoskeletal protein RodZ